MNFRTVAQRLSGPDVRVRITVSCPPLAGEARRLALERLSRDIREALELTIPETDERTRHRTPDRATRGSFD